jgi:HEAT repeat protein
MRPLRAKPVLGATAALALAVVIGAAVLGYRPLLESLDLSRLESSQTDDARAAAMRLAASQSRRAIPRLVKLLKEGDPEKRWAGEAHARLGRPALEALQADLVDGWHEGDSEVVQFLEGLGPAAREAIPALLQCLERLQDGEHRFEVAYAIMEIDPGAHSIAAPLLRSPSKAARLGAIKCLGLAEEKGQAHLADLAGLLADPEREVRVAAIDALESMRIDAATARSLLLGMLEEKEPELRFHAASASGLAWRRRRGARAGVARRAPGRGRGIRNKGMGRRQPGEARREGEGGPACPRGVR